MTRPGTIARILAGPRSASPLASNAATISKFENSGTKVARGHSSSIKALVDALAAHGVEIEPDGLRLIKVKKR